MRKFHAAVISNVPFIDIDEDGKSERTYATFKMRDDTTGFCKRRVKRIMRKWLQVRLGKRIDIGELRRIIARGHYLRTDEVPA